MLKRFNTNNAKSMNTFLESHFQLNKNQPLKIEQNHDNMAKVPMSQLLVL